MRRTAFFLVFLVIVAAGPLLGAERPDGALARILAHDFDGECIPRHGNVLYTDGKDAFVGDCDCAEPRENFDADSDPLIIVARWQVVDTRMESRTKALVTVRARVIAVAQGQNEERKIVPLAEPKDEDTVYRVWMRKGRWLWVDPPPTPRVGYQAVRQAVAKQVDELKDLIATRHPNDLWSRLLPLYQAELAALDALRPIAEANAVR